LDLKKVMRGEERERRDWRRGRGRIERGYGRGERRGEGEEKRGREEGEGKRKEEGREEEEEATHIICSVYRTRQICDHVTKFFIRGFCVLQSDKGFVTLA
jgi:hypothetical protein